MGSSWREESGELNVIFLEQMVQKLKLLEKWNFDLVEELQSWTYKLQKLVRLLFMTITTSVADFIMFRW